MTKRAKDVALDDCLVISGEEVTISDIIEVDGLKIEHNGRRAPSLLFGWNNSRSWNIFHPDDCVAAC